MGQIQFGITTARQPFRQWNVAVTHTNKTANLHANRFPQATHLAVTPFGQGHVIPLVDPFTTAKFNGFKCCRTIFQLNAT